MKTFEDCQTALLMMGWRDNSLEEFNRPYYCKGDRTARLNALKGDVYTYKNNGDMEKYYTYNEFYQLLTGEKQWKY